MKNVILYFLVCSGVILFLPNSALAFTNINANSCPAFGSWNDSSQTCTLTQDLDGPIRISVPGVTLDGAGYTVRDNETLSNQFNAVIYLDAPGTVVRNTSISGTPRSGILVNESATFSLIENVVMGSFFRGINVRADSTRINSIVISQSPSFSTSDVGVLVVNANSVTVENSVINGYGKGIGVEFGEETEILNNTVNQCQECIYIRSADNSLVKSNNVTNGNLSGLYLSSSPNMVVEDNSFYGKEGAEGAGIFVLNPSSSQNTTVRDNLIQGWAQGIDSNIFDDGGGPQLSFFKKALDKMWDFLTPNIVLANYVGPIQFFANDFIDNDISNTVDIGWILGNKIVFFNEVSGGNYWDEFDEVGEGCVDEDLDGFCDDSFSSDEKPRTTPAVERDDYMPVSCELSAPETAVNGDIVTLSWEASGALQGLLNQGIGVVDQSGSTTLAIVATTTISGQFWGQGGRSDCSVTISVVEAEPEPQGASSVLFLPGIQASRLYAGEDIVLPGLPNNIERGDKLWEQSNDKRIAVLAMDENGESQYDIYVEDVLDEVPGTFVGANIYKGFLGLLEDLKTNNNPETGTTMITDYLPFAYDWRYSIFDIATEPVQYENETRLLKDELLRLASSSHTGQVTIIGHSNGGLVAKALLHEYGETELAGKVDKLVMVGTPQLGTPKAINALLHGDVMEGFSDVLTFDDVMRETIKNMPGVYTLLPSARYFSEVADRPLVTVPGGYNLSVYDEVSSQAMLTDLLQDSSSAMVSNPEINEPLAVNNQLLFNAQAEQVILDSWTPPDGVSVYEVVGTGIATPVSVTYEERLQVSCLNSAAVFLATDCVNQRILKPTLRTDVFGDGTVVAGSAEGQEGDKVTAVVNLNDASDGFRIDREHANLTETPVIQEHIKSVILYPYVGDSIFQPEFTQVTSRYTIEAGHSPVALRAETPDGLITGVVDGGIKEEIPGSQYHTLGGSSYIIIPDGIDYTLTVIGKGNGAYTLERSEVSGNGQFLQSSFVASTTDTMLATRQVISGEPQNLETDFDNDGLIDEVRASNGELINDIESPAQTLSFVRRDIDRGMPGGDGNKEFVVDVVVDNELVETIPLAMKTGGGGRISQLVGDSSITARGFKTSWAFTPTIGGVLSTASDSPDLVFDGLRYNKGFGLDKSGKRKKEGFPGDEGAGSKDINPNELILLDATDYLTANNQTINSVTLNVTPRKTDTMSGQLLVLAPSLTNPEEYSITDIIPLTELGMGEYNFDLTVIVNTNTAMGLYVSRGSTQVGVSLEVN